VGSARLPMFSLQTQDTLNVGQDPADALNLFIFEDSGYLAVAYLATSAAPSRVFAPTVASAADASALAAPASLQTSLAPSVGAAALVSAGASVAPVVASQRAFPGLAGISCPALGCLCWKCSGVH